ncbi:hypothetical protein L2E82_19533 [Cichorium intybus]|uniref:Uncharacterized protein n=1 Tax=Cichorium intybus TaxID=13427 RepID=A0ACB9FCQ3_CICIN|nr:hypothetical protein L2E82_19533 [Cichorium intybus]
MATEGENHLHAFTIINLVNSRYFVWLHSDIRLMAHKIDVQLPVQFEDFYVLSFGEITASPSYYAVDHIWPIGYKSCWHDKVTGSLFTCQVSDNGYGGPVFTIRRSSCSKLPIPCGSTVLCRADVDEHDSVVTKLPEINPGSSSIEDPIGDLCFEGPSPSLTWNVMLEKIRNVYEEMIKRDCGVRCYCGHATDLNFFSSVRQVSVDLEKYLRSRNHVNVPGVIQGEKEACEYLELLMDFLRGYGFGLDFEFVQEFIEKLPEAGECSGYVLCKDRLLDSSLAISNNKIKIKEVEPFPVGSLISSRLSSHAVGDFLQVHEFLSRFKEVLEVEEDCLSYEDLENELLSSWPVTYEIGGRAFLETLEMNLTKSKVDKLTTVHMALLPKLVSKLLRKIGRAFNIGSDAKDTEKNKGKKVKLEMFPINQLTWPEVVRRYILACLLMGGEINSLDNAVGNNIKLIRCLQGDDGVFSGLPAGVAGADVDAQFLGRAVEKVFGKLQRERRLLSTGTKADNSERYGLDTDFSIPEWAKVLDPVRKLPTNVGSRIRNCVREALKKNPPEWALKLLEASIAKDFYKGNASGPTKRAVIDVLKKVSDGQQQSLPPGRVEIKSSKILSDTVMKKCRVILRQVAGCDTNRVVSDLVGRNFNCDENDLKIVFGTVSRRPLDLRTIDLRLVHGTYGGSHEAFLEDVREVWSNLRRTYMNRPSVMKLVDEMSSEFKLQYEKEVVSLFKRFYEDNMNRKAIVEIEKELEEILNSSEIPKVPWETGICKVCGQNRDDTNVLLCDTEGCNAEYHRYCLTPPLSEIPEGDWFCPTCLPPNQDNQPPQPLQNILQFLNQNSQETTQFLDIVTALKEKEYWELDADKKTFLLKFLCDEILKTGFIRTYLKEPIPINNNFVTNHDPTKELSEVCLRKEFLGTDSDNRFYWGFPKNTTHHGVVVNEGKNGNSGAWFLFQSDEQITELIDYLKRNDPTREELRNSISEWRKSTLEYGQTNPAEGETVFFHNSLATNASELLDAKYNTDLDSKKKPKRKNMAKWERCECLEPVLPCRYHCLNCHETFFTNVEFEQHKNCVFGLGLVMQPVEPTGLGSGVVSPDQVTFGVPESSLKPIVGWGCDVLRQLKINLLDIEAALPDGAKRGSRATSEWRSTWCSFVKSANTIFEMVEATMVLETMIKTEYIKNTWWWYWSSAAAAAKTSTISALALRIYTLDAAIDYQKTTTTTAAAASSGQKQSRKRKHTGDEVKEGRKKKPKKQEMKEQMQNIT